MAASGEVALTRGWVRELPGVTDVLGLDPGGVFTCAYTCKKNHQTLSLLVHFSEYKLYLENGVSSQVPAGWVSRAGGGLETLSSPPGLTAARPEHPAMPAASCPFQRTPPLTLGSDSLGEQMPGSMGAGGLRKWLFVWGTQPVCLMGEGLAASVTGPDS